MVSSIGAETPSAPQTPAWPERSICPTHTWMTWEPRSLGNVTPCGAEGIFSLTCLDWICWRWSSSNTAIWTCVHHTNHLLASAMMWIISGYSKMWWKGMECARIWFTDSVMSDKSILSSPSPVIHYCNRTAPRRQTGTPKSIAHGCAEARCLGS